MPNPLPDPLPLVSIVTPSLNQGQYIEETILSVLNQDYPNIEYTVIDGGSTDETIDILKKYQEKLLWVSEKGRGQTEAIHKGFKNAKGAILAWLNSDDLYSSDAVGKAVGLFNQNPEIRMVYGKTRYIDAHGKNVGQHPTEPFNLKKLAVSTFICQPSTFSKKDAYLTAGGLNIDLHYTMDYDLWVRIARQFSVEYLPEVLSEYRLHDRSKTVSDIHSLRFHREILQTIMGHYNWAPANRVYGYGYHLVRSKIPRALVSFKLFLIPLSLRASFIIYLHLNKKITFEGVK